MEKIERGVMSYFVNNFSEPIAIVFLGGEISEETLAHEFVAKSNLIVCADSGAEHARKLSLDPHVIIGDLDSVSLETIEYFRDKNCEIIYIANQDSNDFEKALDYIQKQFQNSSIEKSDSYGSVFVFGMTGGRTDHTLANFSVMLRYTDLFDNIIAFEQFAEHRFLTTTKNNCKIECEIGTTISLTPFGEANGIVTENLQYPLSRERLSLGVRDGLSNRSTGSPVIIAIESGTLLVTVD